MSRNESSPGTDSGATPTTTITSTHHSADTRQYIDGLGRRREASYRLPVLVCGHSDPWLCDHHDDPTEKQVDGAASAAEHLRSLGLTPLFPVGMCRALYRQGYRELASELGSRWTA